MVDVARLSDDARVIALICSSVAAARGEAAKPVGPMAWARLAARLADRGMGPASLLGLASAGPDALAGVLDGLDLDRDVVARQLGRSAQLAFELDRLGSRGIALRTLADETYPTRLRHRLGDKAPPVLFTAGDPSILADGGVAIVGSREVDDAGSAFAAAIAFEASRTGRVVVSGGARGVDQVSMASALDAGGRVAGLLPEGLERRLREGATRAAIADGQVALASPYHPGAGFSAGAAMGRNRLIYALSDVAVVVASASGTGGTWTGAVEAIKARWVPVYVRVGPGAPRGNLDLAALGGRPLTEAALPDPATEDAPLPLPPPDGEKAHADKRAADERRGFEQGTLDL